MTRQTKQRQQSTVVQDRDARLAAEAAEWAKQQVRQYFEANKQGFFLPSDVLAVLDDDVNAPPAWLRWLSQYQTRYNMVRNACVSLERKGYLETRAEQNALGAPSTAYQRARDLDDWNVTVKGGEVASVTDLVTGWLRANPRAFRGVRAITITRRESTTDADAQRKQGSPQVKSSH